MENILINGPKILKYIKIVSGYTDKEMASICGYSYSHYRQSILTGKKPLDLKTYFHLSCQFQFDAGSIHTGRFEMKPKNDQAKFLMPGIWKDSQYSSGSLLHVYISYFKKVYGEDGFKEFCLINKVDPLYFFNRANPINISFIQLMLRHIILNQKSNYKDIIADLVHHSTAMSSTVLKEIFDDIKKGQESLDPFASIIALMEKLPEIEKNHSYSLESQDKESMVFSIKPNDHIDMRLWATDPTIGGFVDVFSRKMIKDGFLPSEYEIETLQSALKLGEKSIFKVYKNARHS